MAHSLTFILFTDGDSGQFNSNSNELHRRLVRPWLFRPLARSAPDLFAPCLADSPLADFDGGVQ